VITDVPGVQAGHWTGEHTGVTVVVLPPGAVGSGEIRGGAPATRETAVLDPLSTVEHVDAVVLSGGSAFGLAAADGVMRALAEQGRGFVTRGGPVPIVPAAAIFDLVASGGVRPGPEEGRMALAAAQASPPAPLATGLVGAGRGARVANWRGADHGTTGGLGSASAWDGDVVVGALAVVNAVGDVIADDGTAIVASAAPAGAPGFPEAAPFEADALEADALEADAPEAQSPEAGSREAGPLGARTNTTLVVVATNARCSKVECHLLARSAHHGMARAIHPSHTRHDGDIVFALATGAVEANLDRLRVLVTEVTAGAIRDAVAYHRDQP
jgi:L-aminopeptidase/D-esterase-like protein